MLEEVKTEKKSYKVEMLQDRVMKYYKYVVAESRLDAICNVEEAEGDWELDEHYDCGSSHYEITAITEEEE